MLARNEGRYEDARRHLLDVHALVMKDGQDRYVGHLDLLEWRFLVEVYPPAREALVRLREEQGRRLLAGDVVYGAPYSEYSPQPTRFGLLVRINDILEDSRATYELFVRFVALMPERARREALMALPAVVEAGDFALGERYLPDPMTFLPELNRLASGRTLSPYSRAALAGLATDEMRDKVREDLESPGAILRWASAQHMAQQEQL